MSVTETLIDVFSSFFLYELVLLVGKYLICKYKALSIVRHHHWNSLHAQLHFLTKPWFFSASRLTSVNFCIVSLMSVTCLLSRFLTSACYSILHSQQRKKGSDSSLPPKASARKHWPSQGKQPREGLPHRGTQCITTKHEPPTALHLPPPSLCSASLSRAMGS